jgi:hypothetical protein
LCLQASLNIHDSQAVSESIINGWKQRQLVAAPATGGAECLKRCHINYKEANAFSASPAVRAKDATLGPIIPTDQLVSGGTWLVQMRVMPAHTCTSGLAAALGWAHVMLCTGRLPQHHTMLHALKPCLKPCIACAYMLLHTTRAQRFNALQLQLCCARCAAPAARPPQPAQVHACVCACMCTGVAHMHVCAAGALLTCVIVCRVCVCPAGQPPELHWRPHHQPQRTLRLPGHLPAACHTWPHHMPQGHPHHQAMHHKAAAGAAGNAATGQDHCAGCCCPGVGSLGVSLWLRVWLWRALHSVSFVISFILQGVTVPLAIGVHALCVFAALCMCCGSKCSMYPALSSCFSSSALLLGRSMMAVQHKAIHCYSLHDYK